MLFTYLVVTYIGMIITILIAYPNNPSEDDDLIKNVSLCAAPICFPCFLLMFAALYLKDKLAKGNQNE